MNLPFIFVAEVAPTETYGLRCRLDADLSPGLYARNDSGWPAWPDRICPTVYWSVSDAASASAWPRYDGDDDRVLDHTLTVLAFAVGRAGMWLQNADSRPEAA